MSPGKDNLSRREFLQVGAALSVFLALPFEPGSMASPDEQEAAARLGYGRDAYGSGPYGPNSHNLYLPAVHAKGA